MPKLKRLSGAEIIAILKQFDFEVYSQRGSHVKLRRISRSGKETLTVPNHRQLDTGTCRAIYRQACRYIPESDLFRYFYE
ncbi:MAG: type II toxin-antitoxin system HicA family toxin [Waterburya sp.]